MSAYIQQYLYMEPTPCKEGRYHYDPAQDLLYIAIGSGSERFSVVGNPEAMGEWIDEVAAAVHRDITRAVAERHPTLLEDVS